ncbi:hypothetical protein K493DRAFT_304651 [Basidiobolus meristosporus CBS 931.73]|uniref:Uncharacterized protein n=1 Tax=Basidiobolus meristosporus CBS 931.73 TaxID=1314790 RepID=A0A1Y1XYA2_9FUNG|nr:hypothetical protein K493DRAFT_304651 [Basidiobolus meristosporus CBS 931.73]|eukprot:ORX90730.1 hypothetical protein K493DRAFT_304651 [Basidiobolus meristosporus CBS 931.73]
MIPTASTAACPSVQELPPYSPGCRGQAKCEEVSPPAYSVVDLPIISFNLRLSHSSERLRSVNMPDLIDIRSTENNLPLYLVNKCYFNNITSTFALADSFTNCTVVQATKDIRRSQHFEIEGHDTNVSLRSASFFRAVYKFTLDSNTFRWSFDGDNLSCELLSTDPQGRRVKRSVGGVTFFDERPSSLFGQVWMFQRAGNDVLITTKFEQIFLMTAVLVMFQADRLQI